MPWTDSTSSDSSPYQPEAPHSLMKSNCLDRLCWYWPLRNCGSPVAFAKLFASDSIVGEA